MRAILYAKGRVYKRGETWFYDVLSSGDVVMCDNTNDWSVIFDGCFKATSAAHLVTLHGHRLPSWADVMASES